MNEQQAQAVIEQLARTNAILEAIARIIIEEHKYQYHRLPWWKRVLRRLGRQPAGDGDGVAA